MKLKRILKRCECKGCFNKATVGFRLKSKSTGKEWFAAVCEDCAWKLYEGKFDESR